MGTNTAGILIRLLGEIARAVADGQKKAIRNQEYLAEREPVLGGRPRAVSSPAHELFNGAFSYVHGIASRAAELIRDLAYDAAEDDASGLANGLRRGVIGGVLKPVTSALDLIAEPAAGFRSLYVSERNRDFEDSIRPPHTFLSTRWDRLALYDLNSAFDNAILCNIN